MILLDNVELPRVAGKLKLSIGMCLIVNNKAVVLGCNYYIGLSTIRCLGKQGVHTVGVDYTDKNTYALDSKYCSEKLIAPYYKEDQAGFIRFLKEYASKQSAKPVLIPCHDNYVEVVDAHLDELKEYYLIPQTEQGLYTKLMNKETLQKIASELGVATPETVRVNEADYLDQVDRIIHYPCIVKPTDSPAFVAKFRKKLFLVANRQELVAAVGQAHDAGLEVIVQRIIPGFDRSYVYVRRIHEPRWESYALDDCSEVSAVSDQLRCFRLYRSEICT